MDATSILGGEEVRGGEQRAERDETLSKDKERRSGEVDCCACRSLWREIGGRRDDRDMKGSSRWPSGSDDGGGGAVDRFDFVDLGASESSGAGARGPNVGGSSGIRLGVPTSRLPRLLSKRLLGCSGLLGGVTKSSSTSLSSGMTLDVSDVYALCNGVFSPVDTPESGVSFFRRSTTRFFRFRMPPARERVEPRLSPADDEKDEAMVGRELSVSLPVLSDATEDAPDFRLPNVDWILDRLPCVRAGVAAPDSGRSGWPAHARKTASRMPGVKSDRVRWDSERAASRRMFFCEKDAWISPESRDRAEIWASSRGLPKASTAS